MGTMFSGLEVEIFKTTPQEATFFALNQERNLKIGVIACKSAFFCFSKMGPISFRSLIFIFDPWNDFEHFSNFDHFHAKVFTGVLRESVAFEHLHFLGLFSCSVVFF